MEYLQNIFYKQGTMGKIKMNKTLPSSLKDLQTGREIIQHLIKIKLQFVSLKKSVTKKKSGDWGRWGTHA